MENAVSRLAAYLGSSYKLPTITCRFPLKNPVPKAINTSDPIMAAMPTALFPAGMAKQMYPINIITIPDVTIFP